MWLYGGKRREGGDWEGCGEMEDCAWELGVESEAATDEGEKRKMMMLGRGRRKQKVAVLSGAAGGERGG